MKTPITRQRLRNHLTYAWWKYALLIVAAIAGWNMFYTVTRYRAPENKKVIMNLYVFADQEGLDAYMAQVNATLMPEMEEMNTIYTLIDDSYGEMIFTAQVTVSEGDVYLLSRAHFQQYASTGVFRPLETDEELMAMLEEAGISISQGWRVETESGEMHLYGIPCVSLPGLAAYVADPTDCFLAVLYNNQNDEPVMRFFNILIADMLKEPEIMTPEASAE